MFDQLTNAQLSALLNRTWNYLLIADGKGAVIFANEPLLRATGLSVNSHLTGSIEDFFLPDDHNNLNRNLNLALSSREAVSSPFFVRLANSDNYLRFYASAVRDKQDNQELLILEGQPLRFAEMEQADYNDSLFNFHVLADHIAQLAWMADAKGWIYWYNQRWFDYTGTSLEEMQGWGWKAVHHPDHLERVISRVQHSWDTGEIWEDVFPLRSKEGEYRWFLSRALPIRNAAGEIVRWFGTNTDVTEQRNAELSLLEAAKQKDEFLAILGHELRNPIATLMAAIDELPYIKNSSEREIHQQTMVRQVNRLKRLVDDLVDISRLTRGTIQLSASLVEMNSEIRTCINSLMPQIREKKLMIEVDLADRPLHAWADSIRLQQILGNLLHNAIKYTDEGGSISIRSKLKEDTMRIEVADSGRGIPAEKLALIFDPFTQLFPSMDRNNTGMGIGLSVVKQLSELHGAKISAESEGEGKGSLFILEFPAALTENIDIKKETETMTVRSMNILIAEDNRDLAFLLKKQLERRQQHVCALVHDGTQVAPAIEADKPEVVLMDIGLPGLDGFEIAKALREHSNRSNFRLIALSGYSIPDDKRSLFDSCLLKPVDMNQLMLAIATP